jgi:type VI secretion system protein ImpC
VSDDEDKYRVYFEAGSGQDLSDPRPLEDPPFCLGILGDFSGRGTRPARTEGENWASRPLIRVTPENVLSFGGLFPSAEVRGLPGTSSPVSIPFRQMEDFHPDGLFERLDLFEGLRRARSGILAGEEDAEGVRKEAGEGRTPADPGKGRGAAEHPGGEGLLDAILQETGEELLRDGSDLEGDLDAFIRRVVRPHAVRPGADRTDDLAALDREVGFLMRAVLHSPGLQSLESLWRSVVFLLSRLETTSRLRVYLVDVSREELAFDLLSTDEPTEWSLARTLLSPVSDRGEELRWAALLGAYEFGAHPEDVPLLQRIALLAETAEVPFVAAGDAVLAGCPSLHEAPDPRDWNAPVDDLWDPLRSSPEAEWVGLAIPSFLLRTPYGPGGSRTKTFAFEEAPSHPGGYLWGNPAILWGVLCARAFARTGWGGLRPEGHQGVEGLSMYVSSQGWGHSLESALSHSAASSLAEHGLMPVIGSRDESEVRFVRMGSVSRNGGAPRAWWRD